MCIYIFKNIPGVIPGPLYRGEGPREGKGWEEEGREGEGNVQSQKTLK
jgi:hypothetical protein